MHNSKICEENAWKQMNEMIRIKIKEYEEEGRCESYPGGPLKKIIEEFWAENDDMFERVWLETEGSKFLYLDYNSGIGKIYKHLDDMNQYLIDLRYQKVNTK